MTNTLMILASGLILIALLRWLWIRATIKRPTPWVDEGRVFWKTYIRGSKIGTSPKNLKKKIHD